MCGIQAQMIYKCSIIWQRIFHCFVSIFVFTKDLISANDYGPKKFIGVDTQSIIILVIFIIGEITEASNVMKRLDFDF